MRILETYYATNVNLSQTLLHIEYEEWDGNICNFTNVTYYLLLRIAHSLTGEG